MPPHSVYFGDGTAAHKKSLQKTKKGIVSWVPLDIGVAGIFDWGDGHRANLKSLAMMSSEIFERGTFLRD